MFSDLFIFDQALTLCGCCAGKLIAIINVKHFLSGGQRENPAQDVNEK